MSQEQCVEIYRQSAGPQDRDVDSARACAVTNDMHVNASQGTFSITIHRKSAVAQNRDADSLRACAVEMQLNMSQRP